MKTTLRSSAPYLVLVSLSMLLPAGTPRAQAPSSAWPGLWGPSRTGVAPGVEMGPVTLKERWRRATQGGYSEVAVVGARAVTLELRDGQDFVVALDGASGRELWSTRIGPTYRGHGGSDDGPIATPAIDGSDVFAVGPHGHLLALDAATGAVRWRHDLVKDFGATVPGWGFGSSPLVEGELVVVPTGGPNSRGLLAFDRKSGNLRWSAPHTKVTAYSSAVSAVIAGTPQIVTAAGDQVFAVSPRDGALLWSASGPGRDIELANSPLMLPGDRVLITHWHGAAMLKVSRRAGALVAEEVWRGTMPRGANGPTIYRDGLLFGFAGPQLVCLDADTGEVRWRERTGAGSLVGAGPSLLLLEESSGVIRAVRASGEGFTEVGRATVFTPGVRSVTGPSIGSGGVFVRNLKEIAAFDVAR